MKYVIDIIIHTRFVDQEEGDGSNIPEPYYDLHKIVNIVPHSEKGAHWGYIISNLY